MIIETLKTLYRKDLDKLRAEIEAYKSEDSIWHFEKGIANSAGNLCLHLVGNLNTYIGVGLAQSGYVRVRELEFSSKNIPKKELLSKIDDTTKIVLKGLDNLSAGMLAKDFPVLIWDKPVETEYTLVHLLSHLNYHLGQINYHRRLLDS